MKKTKNEMLSNDETLNEYERNKKVDPEDDFSPLGGYQPKNYTTGDFYIPSGGSKGVPPPDASSADSKKVKQAAQDEEEEKSEDEK